MKSYKQLNHPKTTNQMRLSQYYRRYMIVRMLFMNWNSKWTPLERRRNHSNIRRQQNSSILLRLMCRWSYCRNRLLVYRHYWAGLRRISKPTLNCWGSCRWMSNRRKVRSTNSNNNNRFNCLRNIIRISVNCRVSSNWRMSNCNLKSLNYNRNRVC